MLSSAFKKKSKLKFSKKIKTSYNLHYTLYVNDNIKKTDKKIHIHISFFVCFFMLHVANKFDMASNEYMPTYVGSSVYFVIHFFFEMEKFVFETLEVWNLNRAFLCRETYLKASRHIQQ